jgi:multiple sugar transport system substrate-binding protein
VYVYVTQPEQQSERPVLYWKSDANPQRYDQIGLFHDWLVQNGHVDDKGQPVVELRLDSANTQSKLIQAVSGAGGDILDCDIVAFQAMGVLSELTDAGKEYGFGLSETYPGLADLLSVDGNLYGYPCNVNVVGMWCNKETFEKYGMDAPPEVWTPDSFERIGKEFVKRANEGKSRQDVFFCENPTSGWTGPRMIASMTRSQGLDDFNETRTRCILDDPRYVSVLERLYKWTYDDHLFPSAAEAASMSAESGYGGGGLSLLQHGKYAIIISGRFCLIRIREFPNPPELSLSRFPLWAEFPNMIISARYAGLYAGSKHKDYASLFFAYLADQSYNDYIVTGADGLPPNPAYTMGNPSFENPAGHSNEGAVHSTELRWAQTLGLSMPYSPYYKSTGSDWKKYGLEMLFNNKGSAVEAAAETANRINAAIAQTVDENPVLRKRYEQDCATQAKIDALKERGEKIPASWITNPFYVAYYRSKGMLDESVVDAPDDDKLETR